MRASSELDLIRHAFPSYPQLLSSAMHCPHVGGPLLLTKLPRCRWEGTASLVSEIDNYSPVHPVMKVANKVLDVWESYGGLLKRKLRARGVAFALEYMHAEDEQTNYICIGPVNKVRIPLKCKSKLALIGCLPLRPQVLNMLSAWHGADGSADVPTFKKHLLRVPDYLWVSEDGMKMQGYNGSQGWDASFTMQAIQRCAWGAIRAS